MTAREPTAGGTGGWVGTRLRAAPAAALALGVLVLLTACLAAAFPRAVEGNETSALRRAVAGADPARTALAVTGGEPGLNVPEDQRRRALGPEALGAAHRRVLAAVPEPLRADPRQSAYGVRTGTLVAAHDTWLPRPDGVPPQIALAAQSGLAGHSEVRAGRLPSAAARATAGTLRLEAAVTADTAARMRIRVGSVVHAGGSGDRPAYAVRITGVVAPREPERGYWSAEKLLRTPGLAVTAGVPPQSFWRAALLLDPGAAPALLGTEGRPQPYWAVAPDPAGFTAAQVPALTGRVAWLESGPGLIALREATGPNTVLTTELEAVLAEHRGVADAVSPLVALAGVSTGVVAAVAVALTAGLFAGRRRAELALLRARGGSLAGIGARLLAESAAVAVPAAGLGLCAALWLVDGGRTAASVAAAAVVAALGCAALPVSALVSLRGAGTLAGRADAVAARPGRRRTVAEATLLLLAAGAVLGLRRRGAQDGGDLLLSAAPVLVGLIAALVLVRLYPLPLRWAARPAARSRGLLGFLGLARAGRTRQTGVLPLLVLLVALTTAGFGGSVLASIADARDLLALRTVGADARVAAEDRAAPLPGALVARAASLPGVRAAAAVRVEESLTLPGDHRPSPALVTVDPAAYGRFAADSGGGGSAALTAHGPVRDGGAIPAIASAKTAEALGRGEQTVVTGSGPLRIRVTAVHARTPAVPDGEFLLVDAAAVRRQAPATAARTLTAPTLLLAAGDDDGRLPGAALRDAVRAADPGLRLTLRSEARAAFADAPLQRGAERIFAAAVGAGAAYAALTLVVAALHGAPERTALLARLRTMGLTRRQARALLLVESLPVAVPAVLGGLLVGWAAVELLAPGLPLERLAFAAGRTAAPPGAAPLRADGWTLLAASGGVLLLTALVALVQAWRAARRGPAAELRAGEQGEG
ncbi:hypothetical protein C6N75_28755 [Streptomyces solincola]|uniref:ABC3 transporter permease C-terminal domain-containing protein n=1 Tax=Streptomyces solincola TaxID=2100817 RepID=A0A2S9PN72_9ACTN|nr:ABC transporter permease [Streptomyces solincola]PRH75851.1 hypothetical protein C6N75_28755 [Streptomyces solincola]